MEKKKIIIVGAGPGGLAAGLLLSSKGYSVKIYEKKPYVGGRNSSFNLGDYKFDLGPTFFLMPQVLEDIFIEAGERLDEQVNLIEINPMYRLKFYGLDDFNPYSYNKKFLMYGEMEKIFPYSSKAYDEYMNREAKKFLKLEPCLKVPYLSLVDYLKPNFLKALPYLDAHKSIYDVLGNYYKEEELKLSFTFQAKYIGMSPWVAPGTFSMISYLEHKYGVFHVEGGLNRVSKVISELIIKKGDYVDLVGPIKAKRDTTNMEFANARYSYKDELVHVNTPVKFNDPVSSMVGSVSSATYSPKDSILRGTNFNMKEPDRSARAQNIVLYNKDERKLELVGNAYISSGNDNISGPKIVYYLDTKDAETPTNSVINYDQYTIKSSYAKVNRESGAVFAKKADVKSIDGNEFSANQAKGNTNDVVHFTGNVKGKSKQKEGDVFFTGDKADLYMSKVNNKYEAKKVIVNTKSTFTQLNRKIVSNYMELDLIKKEVYAKDKPVLTIDDGEKGNTLVKADDVTGYIDKELIKLNKNWK